jgi:hypothetical protein
VRTEGTFGHSGGDGSGNSGWIIVPCDIVMLMHG